MQAGRTEEYGSDDGNGHLSGVLLVSDIPPCTNYSGGIFLDNALQAIHYQVRHAFIVLNPLLTPALPERAVDAMSFTTVQKPSEIHLPWQSSPIDIRSVERAAQRWVRDEILPALLQTSSDRAITGYWFLLEGQTMIRLAYELLKVADLPVTVQVMDPPSDWLRAHNVDGETRREVLQKYDEVMRHADACAAGSWAMAERYSEQYGIRCYAVVPSLPEGLGRPAAQSPGRRRTFGLPRRRRTFALPGRRRAFRIALAGQVYAREEWAVLMNALKALARTKRRTIEVHAFTRDPVDSDLGPDVPVRVHAWASTDELLDALQTMDLLYCPYRFGEAFREEAGLCFPSKLTTYLASGRPVLFHGPEYASPAKFLAEWDAAFSCHSLDGDALASVIARAMDNTRAYETVAANGARAFRERLSYKYLSSSLQRALNWSDRGLRRAMKRSVATGHESTPTGVSTSAAAPRDQAIVLVIGMAESVHVARWMNMVAPCADLRFILCPVFRPNAALVAAGHEPINANLRASRPVREASEAADLAVGEIGVFDPASVAEDEVAEADRATGFEPFHASFLPPDWGFTRPGHVAAAIRRFRPVLVVSLEVQFAGYLTLAAKQYCGTAFPRWLLSNWGSDIYLYRKLKAHEPKLRQIAQSIDAYIAECDRDTGIVRQMGFRGQVLPTMPASGGVDFGDFPSLDDFEPPSARREIQIKGYHGWSGRAVTILAAVHLAAPALSNFALRITLAGPEVRAVAETMAQRDGLEVTFEPYVENYRDAIKRLGRARISVGLGISDGISTTLLESMAVGAFPIKGTSSCADEWVTCGRTGILVSPHDVRALADGLARAASDDELVDSAAVANRDTVEQRWNAANNGALMVAQLRTLAQV